MLKNEDVLVKVQCYLEYERWKTLEFKIQIFIKTSVKDKSWAKTSFKIDKKQDKYIFFNTGW